MFTISEIYFKTSRLSHGIFLIRSLTSPRFSYIYIYHPESIGRLESRYQDKGLMRDLI